MSWTDERVELLKTMWADGKSASQIAKELGGVTRNAVIGKVHRLGLSNRASPGKTEEPAEKPAPKAVAKPEPPAAPPAAAPVESPKPSETAEPKAAPLPVQRRAIPVPGQPLPPQPAQSEISAEALAKLAQIERKALKLDLMQLTERTCKWPIGDPATPEFWFCGHPVQAGKPYCEAHVAVAFQPMSSRRDRRSGGR